MSFKLDKIDIDKGDRCKDKITIIYIVLWYNWFIII